MACFKWSRVLEIVQPYESDIKEPLEDEYIGSSWVVGLGEETFKPFLKTKDMALVLFYEPGCPDCEFSIKHFKKAAKTTKRHKHAYASVNCQETPALCCSEKIPRIPYFGLYSRGKFMGFNDNPRLFTHTDMKQWMENINAYNEMGGTCAVDLKRNSHRILHINGKKDIDRSNVQ